MQPTFDDWHGNKTFIQGSEMSGDRNTRAFADQMKTIITGDMISSNRKHQPLYTPPNVANFYLTSNHENPLFLGEHARRFGVLHVTADPKPAKLYTDYCRWLDRGGLEAIYYRPLTNALTTRGSLRTTSGSFFTTKELLRLFNDGELNKLTDIRQPDKQLTRLVI